MAFQNILFSSSSLQGNIKHLCSQMESAKIQQKKHDLTFKNCGVTNRTVATRQTCSSSDDCRVLGNVNSNPLQEEVGTESNNKNSHSIPPQRMNVGIATSHLVHYNRIVQPRGVIIINPKQVYLLQEECVVGILPFNHTLI